MANAASGYRRRPTDANSKLRQLLYRAQQRTYQNKGIYCVFRAFTASLVKSDITVVELPLEETTVPIEPGEELASSVLDITSEKGHLEFPDPARLAMPTLVENHHFYTAVAKFRVNDSRDWTRVPAKKTNLSCCYKDLRECELPPFTRIRVAIFRTILKESKTIQPNEGGTVRSSVEPKISIHFPKDAFKEPNEITIAARKVDDKRIETLKQYVSGCENVIAASDIMRVENMNGIEKAVVYNMPAVDRPKKGKSVGITPDMHTWLVQQLLNKDWKVCEDEVTESSEEGVVSVKSSKPVEGMVMMKMKTDSSAKDAEFAAGKLNQHLDEHVVRFIQKQKKKDKTDILTDCVRTEESDHIVSDMSKRGFTEGQEPSHEMLVREGQAITMDLKGDIRRLDYGDNRADGAIDFVYHSKYRSCQRQFSVEPVNESGQTTRDFYFGHNEYYTQSDEREAKPIHQFEIKIPKTGVHKKRKEGISLAHNIFRQISGSLKEWKSLASELKMDKTQIAKIQCDSSGKPLEQVVFSVLFEWFMTTQVQNKLENLSQALRRLHKEELAKLVPDSNLMKSFFIVRDEAPEILRNWKTMGRHLEVRMSDIEAIDIDETGVKDKVFRVLTTWSAQAKEAATIDKLITVMRRMEMNNTADRLKIFAG
ncbi:uncharacterized protein LOC135494705 isoform X2 [Lineus longissimus]